MSNLMPTLDSNEEQTSFTLDQVVAFLCGEDALDGLWFGQVAPGHPPFWWRKHLRAAVSDEIDTEVDYGVNTITGNQGNVYDLQDVFDHDTQNAGYMLVVKSRIASLNQPTKEGE